MHAFTLLTPPATEPVTLAEAKLHARIDTDADDTLIESLIVAARQWAERYTGRAFITQTWALALDAAPDAPVLALPRAPLQSVTSVVSYANDDTAATFSESAYIVDTMREPGRIVLRSGCVWPQPTRPANGMVVTYVTGYNDAASGVPEAIKTAIRQLVAHWYEHRGDAATALSSRGEVVTAKAPIPLVIEALLASYRIRFSRGHA